MLLFSILIAHYNNFEYFKNCYENLLKQTFTDFEIILVDDHSTDDSFGKIRQLTKDDKRVKLHKNEQNRNVGFTKKKCIELASGEIYGFVNPDDALAENANEHSIQNHTQKNVLTYSKFRLCDNNLKPIKPFPHSRAVKNGYKRFFNVFLEANHFFFQEIGVRQNLGNQSRIDLSRGPRPLSEIIRNWKVHVHQRIAILLQIAQQRCSGQFYHHKQAGSTR